MNNINKIFKLVISSIIISSFMAVPSFAGGIHLISGNWNPETKAKLEKLLNTNANKGKKVVFDFDNTTVSRDIGDGTFAWMIKNKMINTAEIKPISPEFNLDGKNISVDQGADITEYYENIQESTKHQANDTSLNLIGYDWVVQVMAGKTVFDVTEASKNAFMNNQAIRDREKGTETKINVTEGKTSYRVPFFHPENVDLIGNLLLNGYDVYFISASNVWSIRYMVTKELPKLLKKEFGKDLHIKPENIFGVNTLIRDKRTGKLYKDAYLVREKSKQGRLYANLDPEEIKNYELTNQLVSPVPGYEGKAATLVQYVLKDDEKPFLVCGDSPGDFAMLHLSQNKLWFSRLESFDYQKQVFSKIKSSDPKSWLVQPVLYKKNPGFVKDMAQLKGLLKDKDLDKAAQSAKLLSGFNHF